MKRIAIAVVLSALPVIATIPAQAQSGPAVICQTSTGAHFIVPGYSCPLGSYFVSFAR